MEVECKDDMMIGKVASGTKEFNALWISNESNFKINQYAPHKESLLDFMKGQLRQILAAYHNSL